jgi:HEAT repeat protein
MAQLVSVGQKAAFPLLAALNDEDSQIADASAEIPGRIYDKRAAPILLAQLEKKWLPGMSCSTRPSIPRFKN